MDQLALRGEGKGISKFTRAIHRLCKASVAWLISDKKEDIAGRNLLWEEWIARRVLVDGRVVLVAVDGQ